MPRDLSTQRPTPDEAHAESYTPKTPSDWTAVPNKVGDALDELRGVAGGSGAPTNAEYLVNTLDAALTAERRLVMGDGMASTDGGANGDLTLRTRSTVYITDITGAGLISSKVYQADTVPGNKILTAATSDNDDITVKVEIYGSSDAWQPVDVQVSLPSATTATVLAKDWTQVGSDRVWTALAQITDADTSGEITATMSDGDTATATYTRALDPPLILTAIIDDHPTTTGGDAECPLAQTQVSASDQITISGTAEAHCTHVYVKDFEVTNGEGLQGPFTIAAFNAGVAINVGTGDDPTANYRIYGTVGTGGTPGADFTSTESIAKDQTVPTFSSVTHSYPASQEAIKDAETDSVTITHTNIETGDGYVYDDNSTGELTIPSSTTYAATKALVRAGGNYRESGTNYRLTVTRLQKNGLAATKNATVKIAHVLPTLTVTPTTRMRTDDGTNNYKDHTLTLTSSQANLSTHTPTLEPAAGDTSDWKPASSWVASGDLAYTRDFRVEDADINAGGQAANDFTWITISVKNRAGKEATTITTNPTYSIGGFEKRRLTIPAWTNREADTSVIVVDTSKLTAEALSKGGGGPGGGTIQTFDNSPGQGSTPDDEIDKFCISDGGDLVDDDGQFYYNKDQPNAESNTSGTAQVDIEETA